jgi:hypothetical protein
MHSPWGEINARGFLFLLGPRMTAEHMAYGVVGAVAIVLFSTMQFVPVMTGLLLLAVIRPIIRLLHRELFTRALADAAAFLEALQRERATSRPPAQDPPE